MSSSSRRNLRFLSSVLQCRQLTHLLGTIQSLDEYLLPIEDSLHSYYASAVRGKPLRLLEYAASRVNWRQARRRYEAGQLPQHLAEHNRLKRQTTWIRSHMRVKHFSTGHPEGQPRVFETMERRQFLMGGISLLAISRAARALADSQLFRGKLPNGPFLPFWESLKSDRECRVR